MALSKFSLSLSNYRGVSNAHMVTIDLTNQVTFILGQNNAGKSSLLRFFSEFRDMFLWMPGSINPESVSTQAYSLNGLMWDNATNRRSPPDIPIRIRLQANDHVWRIEITPRGDPHTNSVNVKSIPEAIHPNCADDFREALRLLSRSMYIGPVRNTQFHGQMPLFNFSTGATFIQQWVSWSTGDNIRHRQATEDLEAELGQLFCFKKFKMTANHKQTELFISYDDGNFRLSELGDGLSHFIVVLANALILQPTFVLIDEPENGLHPKLQSTFIQALAAKASIGLIASSHSVGLARCVADKTLFCRKTDRGDVTLIDFSNIEAPSLAHALSEMSYSQFSEAGWHNILLVEGRTDIKAYREILKKYGIDQHFIILSLGGGEFVTADRQRIEDELAEIKALSPRSVSVILDSERTSANGPTASKLTTLETVCKDLGFEVFLTDRHSTENYISQEALSLNEGGKVQALAPFEAPGTLGKSWAKWKNWRLIALMKQTDFHGTGLHEFITQKLVPLAAPIK